MDRLFGDGWPAFITADQVVKRYIDQVRRLFADLELVLLDADDVLVAAGWAVPIRWDGDPAHLPEGYTDSLVRAVEGHQEATARTRWWSWPHRWHPDRRGQGLAADRSLRLLDARGRCPARPVAEDPLAPRRRGRGKRPEIADHDRHRRSVAALDRHVVPRLGRLRHPRRTQHFAHRSRQPTKGSTWNPMSGCSTSRRPPANDPSPELS